MNATSYSHTGLQPSQTVHYRVRAANAGGTSAFSNVANATTRSAVVALARLAVDPSSVRGGQAAVGTVMLTAPAPAGGSLVTLSSSKKKSAKGPRNVRVAAGATSANFPVTTRRVNRSVSVTLTAQLGAVTKTATIQVNRR